MSEERPGVRTSRLRRSVFFTARRQLARAGEGLMPESGKSEDERASSNYHYTIRRGYGTGWERYHIDEAMSYLFESGKFLAMPASHTTFAAS